MDPFTFGMVFTGAAGGVAVSLALLQKADIPINEDMVKIFMEVTKYGAILWLMKKIWLVFLF